MSLQTGKICSAYEVYLLFCAWLKSQKPNAKTDPTAALRTALFAYTLLGYGLPPNSSTKEALEFLKTIPIYEIPNFLTVQQQVYESLGNKVSSGVKRTYRSALNKLVDWSQSEAWWEQAISQSKSVPIGKTHQRNLNEVRVTKRRNKGPYALTLVEIDQASLQQSEKNFLTLREHLNQFNKFMTDIDVRKRQEPRIRPISADNYLKRIQLMLGWMHRYRVPQVALEDLSLVKLISSSGLTTDGQRDDEAIERVMDEVYAYLSWLRTEREVAPSTESNLVKALIQLAKFFYHKQSNPQRNQGSPSRKGGYLDIPIIQELRTLSSGITARINKTPKVADESLKWLDWPIYLACVQQFKAECRPKGTNGRRRSDTAIAASIQRYLIAGFLSAIPDRQRTVRELEVGRTLCKRQERWYLEQNAGDYKTGETYSKNSEKRIIPIPEWIYPELEAWLEGYEDELGNWQGYIDQDGSRLGWRTVFHPNHPMVFTQQNGKPLTGSALYGLFRRAVCRITGQACGPHLLRTMVITHFKRTNAPDNVLEALARLMAHSRQMQTEVYDRRTSLEKVNPALEALSLIQPGSLPTVPLKPIEFQRVDSLIDETDKPT